MVGNNNDGYAGYIRLVSEQIHYDIDRGAQGLHQVLDCQSWL